MTIYEKLNYNIYLNLCNVIHIYIYIHLFQIKSKYSQSFIQYILSIYKKKKN